MSVTVTTENLSTVARNMIVDGRRVSAQYDAFVVFYSLDADTESGIITETAREIVLAAYPGTDPARLGGKNKNDDQRWLDARAVRAGLVAAIKRATETDESDPAAPDYLALAVKAAKTAHDKGEVATDAILAAVKAALAAS